MKEVTVINLGEYNNPNHKNIVSNVVQIYKDISDLLYHYISRFKYVDKVFWLLGNLTKDLSQILVC